MQKPHSHGSIEDQIIFQSMGSVVLLMCKKLGLGDDHIDKIFKDTDAFKDLVSQLSLSVLETIVSMADKSLGDEEIPEEDWIVEIANEAVTENLSNGKPIYGSAQGFACAVSALKLAYEKRGIEIKFKTVFPGPEKEEELDSKTPLEKEKERIVKGAIDLYRYIFPKYGHQEASERALEYVAEQAGIVDIQSLGFTQADLIDIYNRLNAIPKEDKSNND